MGFMETRQSKSFKSFKRVPALGEFFTVVGTISLLEKAALGTFVPIKGFRGAYSAVP